MSSNKKIHFEISERKVLLFVFDIFFVLTALYLLNSIFDYNYLAFEKKTFYRPLILVAYLSVFGAIFEVYNLQAASNQFQILKNVILAVSTTVLIYLFTPVLSPELPSQRLAIFIFYFTILITVLLWRFFYAFFLASHRFSQNVVLICGQNQIEELVLGRAIKMDGSMLPILL